MPVDVPRPPDRPPTAPRVSVVVPTYNYGRFLTECVESVLSQSGVDVDVIIVDDASTDDTAAIGFALAARDARVRIISHPENKGHITTFNEGLFEAQGTYVVLLDADDVLAPGSLARSTALLEARPEVGMVSGLPLAFTGTTPQRTSFKVRSWSLWSGHDWIEDRCRSGFNPITTPEIVMRTSVMRDTGGMKHALPHTADFELWMQMAARAEVGRVNGPVQAYYRVHPDSMQRTVYSGVLTDLRGRWGAFDALFAGGGGRFPDAARLHDLAKRAVAGQALDRACRAYDRGRTEDLSVDELVELALTIWPGARDLPQWRALERRRRAGPTRARLMPQFVARSVTRRASEEIGRRRWERTGVR